MKVLVVVDMQNDFINGALGTKEAEAVVPGVVEKIREFDGKIIATRDTHGEDYLESEEGKHLPVVHCVKGTEGWEIRREVEEALRAKSGYRVIDKPAFGSVELSSFFHMSFVGLNESLIESVEQKMHKRLPERTREYLCEFLTEASAGLLLNIISGNMHFDRSKDMMPVSSIIRASIVGVLTEQGIPCDDAADNENILTR